MINNVLESINIFREPMTTEEIREKYSELDEKYSSNVAFYAAFALPPLVDIAALPFALLTDYAISNAKKKIDSLTFSETDKNMYSFVHNSIRDSYDCEDYSAVRTYLDKVKEQGRPLTVGEIKMLDSYKSSAKSASEIGKNIFK